MQTRSASSAPGVAWVCLSTAADSPVKLASSTSKPSSPSSRASAGTTSPGCRSITCPGRSPLAGTVRTAPAAASSCCSAWCRASAGAPSSVLPEGTVWTRRAGSCWSSSSARSAWSARSRWVPLTSAFAASTPPTSRASVGDPITADAAAPVARTGVSGSASSARTLRASALTGERAAAGTPSRPRTARPRPAGAVGVAVPGAGRGSRLRTSSGSRACHGVCSTASGGGRRSTWRAVIVPDSRAAPAAAVTGSTARAVRAGPPTAVNRAPRNVAAVADVTPRALTARAAGTAASSLGTSPSPGPHSTPVPTPAPRPLPPPPTATSAPVGPVVLRDGTTLPPPDDQPVT